jgi:flagellar P-ring protein precursor FlgI
LAREIPEQGVLNMNLYRAARHVSWIIGVVLVTTAAPLATSGARIKDVAALQGSASTPLLGYGLVVGLDKTGDRRQTIFSTQSLANMLEKFGLSVNAADVKVENIAAVLVTAELPTYARAGARLDITASSVGDARSLQGGTLLATPLHGPNGQVYALAQGPLSLGGFGAGGGGTSVVVNHLTVGRVPNGALVQVGLGTTLPATEMLSLVLREPDFVSASRLAQVVNGEFGADTAKVVDPGTVNVRVPEGYRGSVAELMARLEVLPIDTDAPARVVINERTGTIVVGGAVRLGAAAVAHGSLSVTISTKFDVSQPQPFAKTGTTEVVPQTQLDVQEQTRRLVALEEGTTLEAVVRALNALGASPRDIIAIMQALKVAGALRAEIIIL